MNIQDHLLYLCLYLFIYFISEGFYSYEYIRNLVMGFSSLSIKNINPGLQELLLNAIILFMRMKLGVSRSGSE